MRHCAKLIGLLAFSAMLLSQLATALTYDPNSPCANDGQEAYLCAMDIKRLSIKIEKVYMCTSAPDFQSLPGSNCTDLLTEPLDLDLSIGDTVDLSANRLPPGTYTHYAVIYGHSYSVQAALETTTDVEAVQRPSSSGGGKGKYCWTSGGTRSGSMGKPDYMCGSASETPVFSDHVITSYEDPAYVGYSAANVNQGCYWRMGPLVTQDNGSNLPVDYFNTTNNSLPAGCRRFDRQGAYEYCGGWFQYNYNNEGVTCPGLTDAQINAKALEPDGYKARYWAWHALGGSITDSAVSLTQPNEPSDVRYIFELRKLSQPINGSLVDNDVDITDATKGIAIELEMTKKGFWLVVCQPAGSCVVNNGEATGIRLKPSAVN